MTRGVAVAADLDSLALVLRVSAHDPDDLVFDAVDASAVQQPSAIVVDLGQGGRRSPTLLAGISQRCARYAVPLLVAPLLIAPMVASPIPASRVTLPRSYVDVAEALASLPSSPTTSAHRRILHLDPVASAPAQARLAAAEAVRQWGLDELTVAAELITSELVSNTVLHAATRADVLIHRYGQGLQIRVRDGNPDPPRIADHDAADVSHLRGRGLFLVSVVATSWGCVRGSADKVVWATVAA